MTQSLKAGACFTENFETGEISCFIKTKDLMVYSMDEQRDLPGMLKVCTNPENFTHFFDGKPFEEQRVKKLVGIWARRFKSERNPLSSYAVYAREVVPRFVGYINFVKDKAPGLAQVAAIIDKPFQQHGIGTKISAAFKHYLMPYILSFKYDGGPLRDIFATAKPENIGSCKLLERFGFECVLEEEKFGALRRKYIYKFEQEAATL